MGSTDYKFKRITSYYLRKSLKTNDQFTTLFNMIPNS